MMTPSAIAPCRRYPKHASGSGGAKRSLSAVFRGPPVRQGGSARGDRYAPLFACPPIWRRLAGALALLLICLFPLASGAEEKILSFVSAATVFKDSSLEVREDISVNVEGRRIQRGIYRDFPTKYSDSTGRSVILGFSVKSALLGGREVPYTVRSIADGVRVYLGDPDGRAPIGEQTYTLVYVVAGALGFFDDHDELYWN
ncbi:MAG TPA: DUF2207 domain-containing protein, partial [Synergistales bacterium]|nr:DUF2207 domain-containing protein [Synergistales bacterium]